MIELPETQYAISDGLSIAYQVYGTGPQTLILVPGIVSHLEEHMKIAGMVRLVEGLAAQFRVIRFDKRGNGMSDRVVGAPSVDERIRDVQAVMEAVGVERVALAGFSEGSALSLVFAARNPDKISHLIIGGGYAVGSFASGEITEEEQTVNREGLLHNWGKVDGQHIYTIHGPNRADEEDVEEHARLCRLCATPSTMAALYDMNSRIDVRDVLPSIQVPTLVLRREQESISRARAKYISDHVPNAQYRELPGDEHPPYRGHIEDYVNAICEFILGDGDRSVPASASQRVLASVLFTDIVGSTELQVNLGDDAYRDLMNRHDDISKRQIERFNGRFIHGTGDGLLATFSAPSDAIACAIAIRDIMTGIDLSIRAGVHTGEIELRGEDVSGISVNIASRIADQAAANEVLTSDLTRQLMIGSQAGFESRGEVELKGVPGAWSLFKATMNG